MAASVATVLLGCAGEEARSGDDPYAPDIVQLEALEPSAAGVPLLGACKLSLAQRIGGTDAFGEVWDIFPLDDKYILAVDHYVAPVIRVIDERDGTVVQAPPWLPARMARYGCAERGRRMHCRPGGPAMITAEPSWDSSSFCQWRVKM